MADIAASVLARLKNKSLESGRSYQLCLQLFCQEEFLRRLEKSKYAENFVLKGGLFLYSLTHFDSRVTVDVDFLLRKMPNTPEQLKPVLEEIIAATTGNDFVTFELKSVAPISVAKKYAGISASLVARIKNTRTPFSIDFGVGDVIVPRQEKRKIPTQLSDFEAPVVNTYSVETTVAEKLDAILDLMEFSSRMKDYYDIYYLANKFDFDGATLTEALKKTFENRGHHFTVEQFEQVMAFGSDNAMQKKWNAFCRKIDTKTDDYDTVLRTIKDFLTEPYTTAIFDNKFTKTWLVNKSSWTQGGKINEIRRFNF
jgi:predicted nucleotidyltransferase component of viral defense system